MKNELNALEAELERIRDININSFKSIKHNRTVVSMIAEEEEFETKINEIKDQEEF